MCPPPSLITQNKRKNYYTSDEWADKPWTLLVSELAVPFSVIFMEPIDLVTSFSVCVIWSMQACLYLSWLSASCCCNSSIVVLILSSIAWRLTGTIVSDSCITQSKLSLLLKINYRTMITEQNQLWNKTFSFSFVYFIAVTYLLEPWKHIFFPCLRECPQTVSLH